MSSTISRISSDVGGRFATSHPTKNPDIKRIIINTNHVIYMLFVPLILTLFVVHVWKLRYTQYKNLNTDDKIAESFAVLKRIARGLTFFFDTHSVCLSLGIARCSIHPYIMLLVIPNSITLTCLLQASLVHPYAMAALALVSPITIPEAFFVTFFVHSQTYSY